ncbi:MAG: hypothetical protein ACREF3_09935 [Acetobacteraceae bacterium]
MPGTFQAVCNAGKAFPDSFALALRHELRNSGVSVTCLMPGGPRPSSSRAPTCRMRKWASKSRTIRQTWRRPASTP